MNEYTSIGMPARCDARAMPSTSAATVRAAAVGTSGSFASRISRHRRYVSSALRAPAAGRPTLTTSTPTFAIACKRSILVEAGALKPDTLCRPSRSVSSTTRTPRARPPNATAVSGGEVSAGVQSKSKPVGASRMLVSDDGPIARIKERRAPMVLETPRQTTCEPSPPRRRRDRRRRDVTASRPRTLPTSTSRRPRSTRSAGERRRRGDPSCLLERARRRSSRCRRARRRT